MSPLPSLTGEIPSTASPASTERWRKGLIAGFLLFLWGRFFWGLSADWRIDPQYAHGWFIPVLTGILAVRRWQERPEPSMPPQRFWLVAFVGLLLLSLGPLSFLQTAYPEARPMNWFHGLIAAAVSFFFLWRTGGWAWVRHFAFPIFFLVLAIPWPRALQNDITNSLMQWVASVSVELLVLLGIPAWQQGSTIGLLNGVVGVDQACSGIRSLQGSIMVGLFLGAEFRLSWVSRIFLLGSAIAGALLFNVVRATFLTWAFADGGATTLDRFHDPAGLIILITVFVCSLGLAKGLASYFGTEDELVENGSVAWPVPPSLVWVGALGALWLVAADLTCFLHYRQEAHTVAAQDRWDLDFWRAGSVTDQPVSENSRQFLRYHSAQGRTIDSPDGTVCKVIDLQWKGGEISVAGARVHSPLICLPNAGYTFVEELPPVSFHTRGVDSVFKVATFKYGDLDQLIYVYHGAWELGRPVTLDKFTDQSLKSAIRAVWERRRLAEARVLLAMVIGPTSVEQSTEYMRGLLEKVVVAPGQ